VGVARDALDICDGQSVARVMAEHRPDLVINGAAYNLVDKAETEIENAFAINSIGVAHLARAAREADAALVHFSTDYVFDGRKRTPYEETDSTGPLSVYAASKLAGENVTLAASPRHFAIRVSRLFGPTHSDGPGSSKKPSGNFPLLMLRLGRERGMVRVVNDQIGTPSYTPDLALAVWQLVEAQLPRGTGGLFQLTNEGQVAFDEYAREIFALGGVEARVEAISTQEYNAPASRPLYSSMSNAKAHAHGVTPLRHWREALREFLEHEAASS
jgi:dTDP-4-dehydrorhamnose reductase